MKKTKQIEVTVCDVCGNGGKPWENANFSCGICRHNICDKHRLYISYGDAGSTSYKSWFICRTHIDPEILKKLES